MNRILSGLVLIVLVLFTHIYVGCALRHSNSSTRTVEAVVLNKHHYDTHSNIVYRVVVMWGDKWPQQLAYIDDKKLYDELVIGECVVVTFDRLSQELLKLRKCE